MEYWFNTRNANATLIGHLSGYHASSFTFRDYFLVGWDYPNPAATAITQAQYDKLLVDYWKAVAQNFIDNGWIDYVYIMIDESRSDSNDAYEYKKMKHFIEVLKSDPVTAQIDIVHTINYQSIYVWKEFPDTETEPSFKGLIDIWTPYNGEDHYNYYEPYYFTENDINPAKMWLYYVRSVHQNLDTYGLNNRCLPVKGYFFGSTGFLHWASIIYERPAPYNTINPRIDAYNYYGNGSTSYFYPPGVVPSPTPDFTITPSARLEMQREGIEDFEYMVILDDAMAAAAAAAIDTSTAVSLKEQFQRMFIHSTSWSLNDEFYMLMRKRIMDEIDVLNWYVMYGAPEAEIVRIRKDNDYVVIDVYAKNLYRYNLLRTDQLLSPNWQVVDTALVETSDTITLIDDTLGGANKAFYKVEVVIP